MIGNNSLLSFVFGADVKFIILLSVASLMVFSALLISIIFRKPKNKNTNNSETKEDNFQEVNPKSTVNDDKQFEVDNFTNDDNIENDSNIDNNNEQEAEETNVIKSRKGKYEIFKDGEFYRYCLKASNGELLFESDFCISEQACYDAIEIIKRNIDTGIYKVSLEKNQMYQFRLSSRNHRTLVVSSFYSTKKGAEDASESFKRNAVTDNIITLGEDLQNANLTMEVYEDNIVGNDSTGIYKVLPSGKKYYFVLEAPNGTVICHSPDFVSKTSCITGMESFRSIVYDGTFYITRDKNDKYQYKLYNRQNKLVMSSDLYDTKNRVISYIKLIKRYAKYAQFN